MGAGASIEVEKLDISQFQEFAGLPVKHFFEKYSEGGFIAKSKILELIEKNPHIVSPRGKLDFSAFKPPSNLRIVRRDMKDRELGSALITHELSRLQLTTPELSEAEIMSHMSIYASAVWATMSATNDLAIADNIAYNDSVENDPDHWYEINTANAVIFNDMQLMGIPELLPGRLFTTRMPRDLVKHPENGDKFKAKITNYKLDTVFILAETEEYEKYAGEDLEHFYKECGLEIVHRPFADFSVPNQQELMDDIKDITWRLSEGKNCLVHCAGGSGRTGCVIAGVMKNVGVKDPIAWVRRVKTVYVETLDQEKFIHAMPPVIDPRLVEKHPDLLRALAAEHIIDTLLKKPRKGVILNIEQQKKEIGYAFDLLDVDKSNGISCPEIVHLFQHVGVDINSKKIQELLTSPELAGTLNKDMFIEIMCSHI